MKKLIVSLSIVIASLVPTVAGASSYWTQYNAVYGPGGSYWVTQQQAQQNYWNAYNAVYGTGGTYWTSYNAIYGQGGLYCTLYGWNC